MTARLAIPFFFTVALVVLPLLVCILCRLLLPLRWWWIAALLLTLAILSTIAYGHYVGFTSLKVRNTEFASPELPEAFDGYRIVLFSDAHVGTLSGARQSFLQRAVDSINALHPDAVAFTGDIQNIGPDEIPEHIGLLSSIKATDGVFAVLGNHDYAVYQTGTAAERRKNCQRTVDCLRQTGWNLLLNEHRIIRRGTDSLVMAGMENWGIVQRMPRRGNVAQTLRGIRSDADTASSVPPFIVMLQHDPTAWREKILPECNAQLTLSGHTHGGQVLIGNWSPVAFLYPEWRGMYVDDERALYVTTGLGALVPFRLGLPGEIVLITLRRKHT